MKRLTKQLRTAIKDERLAPRDYVKLRRSLKSPRDKRVISGIIKQEKAHLVKLKKIVRRIK